MEVHKKLFKLRFRQVISESKIKAMDLKNLHILLEGVEPRREERALLELHSICL